MIVMEAFGRGLVLEPYLSTVILGGGLIARAGNEEQRSRLLPKIAGGALRVTFASHERQSRFDLHDLSTTARPKGSGWVLDGAKSLVPHGDTADVFVVSARTSGSRRDRAGVGLFLVPASAAGLSRHGYPTQDSLRAAEVSLSAVEVGNEALLGPAGSALPMIERVVDETIAALTAESVGAMEALHALTVEYLKTRRQFGTALGSFQALQHRAVDMYVAVEQARSMAYFAAMMCRAEDPIERRKAIAAAKVQIGRSAHFVGQQAIQLHGGIGMTDEYKAGHYFKRLAMIDLMFGDADHHLARVGEMGSLLEPRN
jgi:alkylation response protein AidB-like acyl-CoA dehydrogenase